MYNDPLTIVLAESTDTGNIESSHRFCSNGDIQLKSVLISDQVVYVARNPKDVIVSYYHHHQLIKMHGFRGDLDTFADYFMKDQCMCSSQILSALYTNPLTKMLSIMSCSNVFALLPPYPGSLESASSSELALRLLRGS